MPKLKIRAPEAAEASLAALRWWLTLAQAHVDAPEVLQALQLLLHASLAAAVVQRRVLQHLQRSLALLGGQHGAALLVPAGQALAHDPVA